MLSGSSRTLCGRLSLLLTAVLATGLAAGVAATLVSAPAPAWAATAQQSQVTAPVQPQTRTPLADLDRTRQRILIVAPHPDDEALGVGGLARDFLLAGSQVWVAFATNGDANAGSAQIWFKTSSPNPSQWVEYGEVRQEEARSAAEEIGIPVENIFFLGYPDSGVDDLWNSHWSARSPWTSPYTKQNHSPYRVSLTPAAPYTGEAALRDFTKVLETVKPTLLFVPHPADTHQDHWATGAFAVAAFEALRASGAAWTAQTRVFEYLVHWNKWPWPSGIGINLRFTLPPGLESFSRWESIDVVQENRYHKSRAIAEYRSQGLTNDAFNYLISFSRAQELFAVYEPLVIPSSGSSVVIPNPNSGWHRPGTPTAISISRTTSTELSVNIQLDRAPVSGQSWLLRFYGITPQSAAAGNLAIVNIQAWPDGRVDVQSLGMGTDRAVDMAGVHAAADKSTLRVTLPLALVPGQTFLLSVETLDGDKSVDKTPYKTLRL